MGAAFLFWGAIGNFVIVGTAIGWTVNAIVYGLVVWVIVCSIKRFRSASS